MNAHFFGYRVDVRGLCGLTTRWTAIFPPGCRATLPSSSSQFPGSGLLALALVHRGIHTGTHRRAPALPNRRHRFRGYSQPSPPDRRAVDMVKQRMSFSSGRQRNSRRRIMRQFRQTHPAAHRFHLRGGSSSSGLVFSLIPHSSRMEIFSRLRVELTGCHFPHTPENSLAGQLGGLPFRSAVALAALGDVLAIRWVLVVCTLIRSGWMERPKRLPAAFCFTLAHFPAPVLTPTLPSVYTCTSERATGSSGSW